MKFLRCLVILLAMSSVASPAHAEFSHADRTMGVGIGVGSQSGISGYYRLSRENFVQGLLSFHESSFFYLSADYGVTYLNVIPDVPWLIPYLGVGGLFASVKRKGRKYFDDDIYGDGSSKHFTVTGARFPIGLQAFVPEMPLMFSIEIAPMMTLTPGTDFDISHLLSARYVF